MKQIFIAMAFGLMSIGAFAANSKVIMKTEMYVGFAPPENQGTFTTQVEADGIVRTIDNNKRETVILKLSRKALQNLKKTIDAQKPGVLVGPDEPICMDAPGKSTKVYQSNGKEIEISEEFGCLEKQLPDAYELIQISKSIRNLAQSLEY